ncbi:related to MFS transporter [Phialocephala subalpina]|uniref:Related to MFS transporter n=1 Tax=Phialocephala subalpina TaxID=576137 RepID=A0A1L7XUH7_9HELO|nr:related to MFS transporter [Phialocephala subalpina]
MTNKHDDALGIKTNDAELCEISVVSEDESHTSEAHIGSASKPTSAQDGGLAGWTCVLGSFFALFCTFGWLNALGLFQTYYEENLLSMHSASTISWIFTIQLFLMWAGGAIFGRVIDTYGTYHVAIPCAIGCTFSVFMVSFCTEYYQILLAQGVGFGLAAAGLFSCATTSVGQFFEKRKALALGIALSGSSTGGFVHPLYLQRLIDEVGFKQAIRWASLVIGVSSALACLLMKARLPRKKWDKHLNFIDFSLFKQPIFSMYCLGTFFVTWGLFAPWNYLPSMSLRHGFSHGSAIYTIVVLNAASTIGRILPAHLADKLGRFNLVSLISILNAIALLAFWFPLDLNTSSPHEQIFVFGAVYGFVSGAFIGVMMSCVAELGSVETLGQRLGTYQFVVGVGYAFFLFFLFGLWELDESSDSRGVDSGGWL